MTRRVSIWLLTGLVVASAAAANHRRADEVRLDLTTMTELSRRLDLVVSGGSGAAPRLPRDPGLPAANRNMVSDPR